MKKSALFSLAALGLSLVAGCGTPETAMAKGVKCKNDTNKNCVITVTVNELSCALQKDIDLDDVLLSATMDEDKFVVWTLSKGYVFCPNANDGAVLTQSSPGKDAFEPVGNPPHCAKTFQWKRHKVDRKDYEYKLYFRSEDMKRSCVKDPWIRNG